MSEVLKIAVVAEGITDYVVLEAAIASILDGSILDGRSFRLTLLQPEESVAFTGVGHAGEFGGGWKGVYQWCQQAMARNRGNVAQDPLFQNYNLLLLHLDADVASEDPANAPHFPVRELAGMLPCEEPCPPADATTNALRSVLLSWLGASAAPPRTVLCIPSKSTESWIMATFFPMDVEMNRTGWECHPKPELRLAQQKKGKRFPKSHSDYRNRQSDIQKAWPKLCTELPEARRFHEDFLRALA